MATKSSLVLFIAALLGAAVSAQFTIGSSFGFYVYGNNGIHGQRLYYRVSDGAAVFTDDTTAANMTDVLVPVNLTVTRRQQPPLGLERMAHSFTATPDIASSPAAAALMPTNTTMFVGQPASNGSDPSSTGPRPATHEVGFVLNAEGDRSTPVSASMRLGGFLIIERRFVYVRDEDHVIYYALFCGLPSKDNPAIWTIQWNVTNDVPERAAGLPVMLRTDKPAKGSKPGNGWGTKCLTRDF